MRYKIFNLLFFFILFSCVNKPSIETYNIIQKKSFFLNKGFTLVYDDKLFNQKLIINVEENSELNILVYTINLNSDPIFLNTSNFYLVEKYGVLKLFHINELKNKDLNYNLIQTQVMENGNFENFILSYSSSFFKTGKLSTHSFNSSNSFCFFIMSSSTTEQWSFSSFLEVTVSFSHT